MISYIKTILLKRQKIMYMNIRLLKAFPRCKMKIPSYLVNFQEPVYITSFTFFLFNSL